MKTVLYALPYDMAARGFFFSSAEDYQKEVSTKTNNYGMPVEEFEIQFIEGDTIDAALFEAVEVHQGDIAAYFKAVEDWDTDRKQRIIIAVGECGYLLGLDSSEDDLPEVDLYETESMKDLAEQFVEEGLFGDIPERLQFYIDHDAIARDLVMDYSETSIAGQRLIYRCG